MRILLIFACLQFASDLLAQPVTVELVADRDNTLYENNAGNISSGAGPSLFSGLTNGDGVRRALLHFDLSSIPRNAVITEVTLNLSITRTISGNSSFDLHEVLADWGEGRSNAGSVQGGTGTAAQLSDATWTERFFDQQSAWNNNGGDFNPTAASNLMLSGNGRYTFPSSDALVDLSNRWLLDPNNNFGLLLRSVETGSTDAKQIASRENGNIDNRPTLNVTFEIMEEGPIAISGIWFDSNLPGDGFNVVQSPVGLFVFYFGYGGGDGDQRWMISEVFTDPIEAGQDIVINMLFGEDGTLVMPQDPSTLDTWGTLTINLTDPDNGTFTLSGIDGDKTFQASKLVGINVAEPGS